MCYTADVGEDLFFMAVEHYTLTLLNSTAENRSNTNTPLKMLQMLNILLSH